MKKTTLLLSFFLLALFKFTSVQAELITSPGTTDDDYYLIKHVNSIRYLSYSGGNAAPVISDLTDGATEWFQFKLVPGTTDTYNILNVESGKYIARKDGGNIWTMMWVADPSDPSNWTTSPTAANVTQNAQFKLVPSSDGTYVSIRNVAGGRYMKTDATSSGSVVYADQSDATSANARWLLSIPTGETDKTALQSAYDAAVSLYGNTQEGSGSDQYPSDARDALNKAIVEAEDIIGDPSATQSVVNAAVTSLNTALSNYTAAVNPFLPNESAIYYIQSAGGSGCYLTTNGNGNAIVAATYAIDQQFKFVRFQTTEYFNIVKASDPTQLLTRQSNGYSLAWGTEQSGLARFRIKSTGDGNYTIECQETTYGTDGVTPTRTNSFMGAESNSEGSSVYIDKDGKDGKHKWKIIDISTLGLIITGLQDAVTKAQEDFLNYAQIGTGPDQYPDNEYNHLVDMVAIGSAILADQTGVTQAEVGEATVFINNALATVKSLVNPFRPDVTKDYQIVHYGGMFLNAKPFEDYVEGTDKPNALEIADKSGADNQKIKFLIKQEGLNITFASVPDKYLTRLTEAQVNDQSKIDDYKLVWFDDATSAYAQFEIKRAGVKDYYTVKCIKVGPLRTASCMGTDAATAGNGVSIDKSGTVTNDYWKVQAFGEGTAIQSATVNNVFVSTSHGSLTINQLEGANRIAIYSIVGQLVTSVSTIGSKFEIQLPKGIYVVTVNGDSPYRGKSIVK